MHRKLQITNISILLLLMAFSSMALAPSTQVLLSMTPTLRAIKPTPSGTRLIKLRPTSSVTQLAGNVTATSAKTRSTPLPPDMQAGTSDWIVALGILIVAIIVIPILLKRKEWWRK
jgi:hypothetical protein